MTLRIFIIILLFWTSVPVFADAARLTLGVAPGAVRDATLENQARQLAAELTRTLGDEVSVRLFDNPVQLGQWLGPFAMVDLGLVDAAFLAGHPGKFLVLGAADQAGQKFVVTRQGSAGDLSQRVAAALNRGTRAPAPALAKPVAASEAPSGGGKRSPQPGQVAAATPLNIGLRVTPDGLIRTPDQARQFTAQLGSWLGVPVRAHLFASAQTLADWFNRFQAVDLALIDEPERRDPLTGNYRPLQRLVGVGESSGLLVSRRDLPEERIQGVLRALAKYGHNPSIEQILANSPVKPATLVEAPAPATSARPATQTVTVASASALTTPPAAVTLAPPVLPRLPEAPRLPPAPERPAIVQPAPVEPPAPVAVTAAEPPAPAAAVVSPAPVAKAVSPEAVAAARPAAPVAGTASPAPAAIVESSAPAVQVALPASGAAPESPPPVPVVAMTTETVAAVPETPAAAAPGATAAPALAGTSEVPAVIAQPDLPQELRPPGVPQPRPGRLPEAAPVAEEATLLGKLQDLFGRTPKPPPLLPPPDPEPGVVYVVPFITLMVPAEFRERAFDQFVDILNQRGGERGLKFVILKQGLNKLDQTWLGERKYVLGEIYGYVEDSGCCSTDLRTRARLTFYRAHLPDPALKYEYPVQAFFDHDQSTLATERQKLADQIAEVLAGELLKVLQP
jgi:hypothetical protein